ncbi:cbb3-type cytochrome oxidase assembly protein CcoS [Advenella mimigardefordensis]|uniref:cbb3-type cytochrome oxidase assembly protein CcoS n=1 Tax=Advenella mimigardefordensis TaxID=302406 RepID=UPI00046CA73C|nr:cbb3-type cytochrome oxidase assembly protein CcoS [Advenella mimigardefordensis]
MDVFFLLVFLAFLFVMSIGGLLYWAVMSGQFDDSDGNASVILQDDDAAFRGPEKKADREAGAGPSAGSQRPK